MKTAADFLESAELKGMTSARQPLKTWNPCNQVVPPRSVAAKFFNASGGMNRKIL